MKCSQSSRLAGLHEQRVRSLRVVHVLAGEPPGDSSEEWPLLSEELDASLLQAGWEACWAERSVVEGDFQCLLEFLDVCSAVRVAEYPGKVLDGVGVVVRPVVCPLVPSLRSD